ncbi:putative methyltransferase-domain-containing protein [Boeremia exigua]|uniref:putative methyltransferase-domain-containing protein n=1 Tax=Boeremia exigua TaxID=749465 RepID=UPI001E8DCFA7|nr:putative methyltransferase-domain-containing protein [Boeremia exigua]KAH6625695.1 putative methyltransferase-domain-containing protein [Boeremia exigua]
MSIAPDKLAQLRILQRQYLQLVDPSQLRWPDAQVLKSAEVQSWIFLHMFDESTVKTPPPERYQLRVLKLLVSILERSIVDPEEDEISDDLMSAMSTLLTSNVPSEADSAQQKAFVTYSYPLHSADDTTSEEKGVTLLEARSVISGSGTTGLRTWEAALLLGSFLITEDGRGMIKGKRVFELGAGTGVISILCAKHLEAAGVVATDGDEAVVDAIKTNTFLNGLDVDSLQGCQIRTAALKWGWPVDAMAFSEDYGMEVPDILLGADVTYDKTVIPRLVCTMNEFLDLNPALEILISATIRNEATFETFLNACRRNGFRFEQVGFPPLPESEQRGPFYPTSTPIQIWRITKPEAPREDPFAV